MDKKNFLNKALGILMIAVSLFFAFTGNSLAADETQSRCSCYNYYGNNPSEGIIGRTMVKTTMIAGIDSNSEDQCHQFCANEKSNPDISKQPTLYIFRESGSEKQITKLPVAPGTPGANEIVQAPANFCSCDDGIPQTGEIITKKSVDTEEGCIFICSEAQGATRMRFNDEEWKPIPAPITSATELAPKSKKFSYKLLESFPGFFSAGSEMNDFPQMILAIYKFGIWTIGIAGLFMLVIGGFMYMASAGNTSTAGTARGIIWDALLGIVAALGAYLMLYVINPDLTKISIDFTPVSVKEDAGQVPSGTMTDADARRLLNQNGIEVTQGSGNCTDRNNSTCTSLQGIPERTINRLINFKNNCKYAVTGCRIVVTGGTEIGHTSHGIGQPMLDVRSDGKLKEFLLDLKAKNLLGNQGVSQICSTAANQDVSYRCTFVETAEHFHLSFGL